MQSVLGEELSPEADELPISLSVAFERLRQIRSFYYFLVGMAALGFALFSTPLFLSLYFEDELGLERVRARHRRHDHGGPAIIAIALAGRRADDLFRKSPPAAMAFVGVLDRAVRRRPRVAIRMPNVWTLVPVLAAATALRACGIRDPARGRVDDHPVPAARRGTAMIGIYVFLFGSFFGSILTGLLSDAYGTRTALVIVVLPSTLIGGALIAMGARHIRADMSMVVEELREEQAEMHAHPRSRARRSRHPGSQPRLLLREGAGAVRRRLRRQQGRDARAARHERRGQVDAAARRQRARGRVRGVVRFNGRTVTYADPELRVKIGIVQLIGGGATFPPLSVEENLRMAGFLSRARAAPAHRPGARDLPDARASGWTPAQDLSGGQQQMLALAMALLHEPEVLIIDELSLGLAPIVVQQLLEVVRDAEGPGLTMIIVEQSLNVALAVSDRAVFMEKGEIRFEGRPPELATRDDLRARFSWPAEDPLARLRRLAPGPLLGGDDRPHVRGHGRRCDPHLPFDAGINFAIGEMGGFSAALLYRLVIDWDVPFLALLLACIAVGACSARRSNC